MRLLRALAALLLLARGRERRRARAEIRREEARAAGGKLPETLEREVAGRPRVEGTVLAALAVVVVGAIAFVLAYVLDPHDTQVLGLAAGIALIALALACGLAARLLVPQEMASTEYHDYGDPDVREHVEEILASGGQGLSRRRLLFGAAGAAGASLAAAAAVPIASLGPGEDHRLADTPWHRGRRVVRSDGTPILAADVRLGQFLLGLPEGADQRSDFSGPVNLMRFAPGELHLPPDRLAAAPEGIVAYSRICTHAGCAVSMLRTPLYAPTEPKPALVCPCHYSTFDPRRGATVEFGPAVRPLPQLPLRINAAGELEAAGDFYDPPGPSYDRVRLQHGRGAT
jgi:ubiquinol-cytochrome c reductase iron-sulfur subunit